MAIDSPLSEAVLAFLEYRRRNPDSTALGDRLTGELPIPTPGEIEFLAALRRCSPARAEMVEPLRPAITRDQAYDLLHFVRRMATFAVRTGSIETLRASAVCLALDEKQLDSQDVLVTLGIVDDASGRLGVTIDSVVANAAAVAGEERRSTIVNGYLRRAANMRGVEIMGWKGIRTGDDFAYVRSP